MGIEHEEPTQSQRLCPFQSLMLAKAKECWEQEHEEREAEKVRYLSERIPTLQTRGLSLSALQVSLAGWAGLSASCKGLSVDLEPTVQLCNLQGAPTPVSQLLLR